MATTDLRPLGLGELLDRAFWLYRRNFLLFLGIVGIPQLFLLAFNIFVQVSDNGPTSGGPDSSPSISAGFVGFIAILGLVMVVVQLVGYALSEGATVYAVSELLLGRPTTIRKAFGQIRGEIGTIVAVLIMVGLATSVAFLLLIVPGVYVLLATSLAVPAAVLENIHAREAIRRSMDMTKGHKGRVFVIFLLVFALSIVAYALFQLPFDYFARQAGPSMLLSLMRSLGEFFGGIVAAPLGTIAFSLLYYDIRVREEAFDLQMMMAQLDGSPLPSPRPAGPLSILGR